MADVTSFTAERSQQIENAEIVSAEFTSDGTLHLIRRDETIISGGSVKSVIGESSGINFTLPPYSADRTGNTDCTDAIKNAIADLKDMGGSNLYVPYGIYKFDEAQIDPIPGLRILCDGYKVTTFLCSGAGSYLFNLDPVGLLVDHLEDFRLTGVTIDATGMDIFWGANMVRSQIYDNYFIQNSPGKAIMNISPDTGAYGQTYLAENYFSNKESIHGTGRTIEAWHLDMTGPAAANDNVWEGRGNKIWTGGDPGAYWFFLKGALSGSQGSNRNKFRDLIFELSGGCGGLMHIQNVRYIMLDHVSSEDLGDHVIPGPLFLFDSVSPGPGPGCNNIKIRNYSRPSGTQVDAAHPDFKFDADCKNITIDPVSGTYIDFSGCEGPVTIQGSVDNAHIYNPPTSKFRCPGAAPQTSIPNTANTTSSASKVHAGYGVTFTPTGTGLVRVLATASFYTQSTTTTGAAGLRYGTGTPPPQSYEATVASGTVAGVAGSALFTATGSTYALNDPVYVSGDTQPGNFVQSTIYYVIPVGTGTFGLAASQNGAPIAYSSAGTVVKTGTPATGTTINRDHNIRAAGNAAGAGPTIFLGTVQLVPGVQAWFDFVISTTTPTSHMNAGNPTFLIEELAQN